MKTTKITLQSQDFVFSRTAELVLLEYLKKLQRATRLRPGMYRQNIEALRDVLLGESSKTISKARLVKAIDLVGLPDQITPAESLTQRFPRAKTPVRLMSHLVRRIRNMRWRHILLGLGIAYATLMAIASALGAISLRATRLEEGGWGAIQTSIGPVRAWAEEGVVSRAGDWSQDWVIGLVYSVLFAALATVLFYILRKKRPWPLLGAFVSVLSLLILWNVQQANMPKTPPEGQTFVGGSAQPLKPRLAYLQQCGDEIPYVFEGQTSGMLFRQLRDDGYKLVAPIKTRVSDGTIDTAQLCTTYDVLRREHATQRIVLQMYTQASDGIVLPYNFSDIQDGAVTSSYGFFVKP